MSQLNVDDIYNNAGTGNPNLPAGVKITGVTTFLGSQTEVNVSGISTLTGIVNALSDVRVTGNLNAGVGTFSDTTSGISTTTGALVVSGGIGIGGSVHLNDSKGIILGSGADLQIVHDHAAGDSYITDAGTGALKLDASEIVLQHAQSAKITTTPTGAVVTGILTATTDLKVGTTVLAEAASGIVTAKSFVPSEGQLSNRNLIFNGDMQLAQRGTSSTTSGFGSVDRFETIFSGHDEAVTHAQAAVTSGTPYELGFRQALKLTNGNQTGGAGATDTVKIQYRIEAQDMATCGWHYDDTSSFVTLSFWVKSSVAQNFYGALVSNDGSALMYNFETGSLSADTWTKVTKTIPGNASLTFTNDIGIGLEFRLFQYLGTTYTNNSVSNDAWAGYGNPQTKVQTTTWYTTDDATLELTGVQLEVGSAATPFEHRSVGDELARCQRYYQKISGNKIVLMNDYNNSTSNFWGQIDLRTTMRTSPTVTVTAHAGGGTITNYSNPDMLSFNTATGAAHFDNSTIIEATAEL